MSLSEVELTKKRKASAQGFKNGSASRFVRRHQTVLFSITFAILLVVAKGSIIYMIQNGTDILKRRFPYMAYLMDDHDSFICAAILVHPLFALSTAHCVKSLGPHLWVHIGGYSIGETEQQVKSIKEILIHPNYTFHNNMAFWDIALLKLTSAVSGIKTPTIHRVRMLIYGRVVVALSWGSVPGSGDLQMVDALEAGPSHNCSSYPYIQDHQVCLETPPRHDDSPNKIICEGSAGGPILQLVDGYRNTDPESDLIIGMISSGQVCETPGSMGFYIQLSDVHNWLEEQIENRKLKSKRALPLLHGHPLVSTVKHTTTPLQRKIEALESSLLQDEPEAVLCVALLRRIISDQSSTLVSIFATALGVTFVSVFLRAQKSVVNYQALDGAVHKARIFENSLGEGTSSRVFEGKLVRWFSRNRRVVIKIYKKTEEMATAFEKEKEIFEKIQPHPNIVECLGSGSDRKGSFIVMEYMQMDLSKIVKKKEQRDKLTYKSLLRIFLDIAKGLSHLSKHHVVHYDLKPSNILVNIEANGYHAKVADFGVSELVARTTVTASGRGTLGFMAPEVIDVRFANKKVRVDGKRIDVFSFGRVMFSCIMGVYPGFENESSNGLAPKKLMDLVHQCESVNYKDRPKWIDIVNQLEELLESEDEWLNEGLLTETRFEIPKADLLKSHE